jgi:hypothetical protein
VFTFSGSSQRVVNFRNAGHWHEDFGNGLTDSTEPKAHGLKLADLWQFDINNIAKRILRVIGDTDCVDSPLTFTHSGSLL